MIRDLRQTEARLKRNADWIVDKIQSLVKRDSGETIRRRIPVESVEPSSSPPRSHDSVVHVGEDKKNKTKMKLKMKTQIYKINLSVNKQTFPLTKLRQKHARRMNLKQLRRSLSS